MKRCPGPLCKGELRPLASFGPNSVRPNGLQSYCRDCNKEINRLRRRGSDSDSTMASTPIPELEPDLEYRREESEGVGGAVV